MPKVFRIDVVLACVCAVVLVASTFGDWYLYRAVIPHGFHFTPNPEQDFMRVALSPWQGEKALAGGIVLLACGAVTAMILGETEKLARPIAGALGVLAALTAVSLFVVKLLAASSASVGMMDVRWSPLAAFYVAACAAAALLVASAVLLYRNTRPTAAGDTNDTPSRDGDAQGKTRSISTASSPSA